jgi:uncharacterized protein YndB with AHSA1/START domain
MAGPRPPPTAWKRTLVHAVSLAPPPEAVFAFVTNPGRWHTWHPNTRDVDASADHPLGLGEQVVERIRIGPFRGVVTWEVTGHQPARRWTLLGQGAPGFASELEYTLSPEGAGTHFQRVVKVTWPGWYLLGGLTTRRLAGDAAAALENLRRTLAAPRTG